MSIPPEGKSIENLHKCREKYIKCRTWMTDKKNKLTDSLWVNLSIYL